MTTKHNAHSALLKLMVRADVLTAEQAQAAETDLVNEPGSVIDWLTRNGIGTEETLARIIATQLQLPYVNLAAQALSPAVTNLVTEEQAVKSGIVPLRAPDGNLVIAMANPLDRDGVRLIELATGRRIHIEVATQTAVRDALEHAYHLDDVLNAYLQRIPENGGDDIVTASGQHDIKGLLRETSLPPVVKLLNLILMEGVRSRASDIHIEPSVSGVRVRLPVDGLLEEAFRLPKWIQNPLTARCKVLARLDIGERRVAQNGRTTVRCHDQVVDLRVSSLPAQF